MIFFNLPIQPIKCKKLITRLNFLLYIIGPNNSFFFTLSEKILIFWFRPTRYSKSNILILSLLGLSIHFLRVLAGALYIFQLGSKQCLVIFEKIIKKSRMHRLHIYIRCTFHVHIDFRLLIIFIEWYVYDFKSD